MLSVAVGMTIPLQYGRKYTLFLLDYRSFILYLITIIYLYLYTRIYNIVILMYLVCYIDLFQPYATGYIGSILVAELDALLYVPQKYPTSSL